MPFIEELYLEIQIYMVDAQCHYSQVLSVHKPEATSHTQTHIYIYSIYPADFQAGGIQLTYLPKANQKEGNTLQQGFTAMGTGKNQVLRFLPARMTK